MSADDATTADGPGSDGLDTEQIGAEAREAVDTAEAERLTAELTDLLESDMLDSGGSDTAALDGEKHRIVAVAKEVADERERVRRRYRRQVRERRAAAREAAESDDGTDGTDDSGPLAGALSRARDALTGDGGDDGDGPEVAERDGRPVVDGECPIGAVELVRIQQLDENHHGDVHVRNETTREVRRGPRPGESDSPLVPKYHSSAACSNADFSPEAYSHARIGDAKEQAVPCPSCMLTDTSIQTLADALDAAPEHDDLPYGERERVAERSGWPDDGERHDLLKRVLRGDGGMTAGEVADHRTVGANQQAVAQALKSMREAGAVETETDGETGRTTWRLTTFAE